MPKIPFSEVTSSVASQVASVLEQFTSQGVEVWLRFGHEMNYYVVSKYGSPERKSPTVIRGKLGTTLELQQSSSQHGRTSMPLFLPNLSSKWTGHQTYQSPQQTNTGQALLTSILSVLTATPEAPSLRPHSRIAIRHSMTRIQQATESHSRSVRLDTVVPEVRKNGLAS